MKREYKKPDMMVTSFATIDVTSNIDLRSGVLTPAAGRHTNNTFVLHR